MHSRVARGPYWSAVDGASGWGRRRSGRFRTPRTAKMGCAHRDTPSAHAHNMRACGAGASQRGSVVHVETKVHNLANWRRTQKELNVWSRNHGHLES